ncbi:polymorphic toxin type 50 domain-containing protein [Lysinibacillus sphaericus]|uniref:polymorphic toxin type 50 domain-containing protein n=1 Tax=Lysinibacillus sphaericus TaxID=1421 RepID=UPI0038297D5E
MSKYWESRAAQRELESQLIASKYLARIEEQLRMAQANIIQQIEAFYARYAIDYKFSYAEAKQYLTAKELKDFRNITLQQYKALSLAGNPEYDRILNAIGYRARISRLEMLHLQIQMQMLELYGSTNGLQAYTYTGLSEVYENAYYKTLFDIATFTAVYQPVTKLTDDVMKEVLTYNWSGKEFSKRIWGHEAKTMAVIKKELERSFKQGRSLIKTSRAISEATNVALSRAQALVRTEANFFHGLAANNAYRETNLDRYQILATLDNRTSEICKAQDLKIYLTKDYKPGTNAPPFHTRCRTTTIPYFDEAEYMEGEKRIARDPLTDEKYYQDANLPYTEWYQVYVVDKYGQEKVETFKKRQRNLNIDKDQYRKYKKVLGKSAPKSFEEFQDIKYSNGDEWNKLQDNLYVKTKLQDGTFGTKINPEKQAPHMESTQLKGKSYFFDDVDVQKLFDKYAGTGVVETDRNGRRKNTEVVFVDDIVGIAVSEHGTFKTNKIKIHHSKKRTHLVPIKPNKEG